MANVEVILTFDDGPDTRAGSANGTQRVLSALESNSTGHAINAVFFIQTHAKNDQDNYFRGMHSRGKQIVGQMDDADHIIGVHTGMDGQRAHGEENDHPARYTAGELANDLTRAKDFISRYGRQTTRYVRPPFGNHNADVQRKYNEAALYRIMWDIESGDALPGSNKTKVKNTLKREVKRLVKRGDRKLVILFHDTDPDTNTAGNLDEYIQTITTAVTDEGHTPVWNLTAERIRQILDEYGKRAKQQYE
ncbi:MAG: polysaccharide deacetylase family protein [Candidatus Poribacteria bacterium]|nr:polysaccharide deacetylase family protein [Candidatus Poribacteria bacterium]